MILKALFSIPLSAADLSIGGSLKSIGDYTSSGRQFQNEERLRTELVGDWSPVRFEYAGETSYFYSPLSQDIEPPPAWKAKWQLYNERDHRLIHQINRLTLQAQHESFRLTLGKQVVPMGVGQIFHAVNQTPLVSYLKLDSEYSATEDGITFSIKGKTSLETRYLFKTPGQQKNNFHGRLKQEWGGVDSALTGGQSDDKRFVGLELASGLGEAVIAGEGVAYFQGNQRYLQALLALSHALSSTWSFRIESFYNEFLPFMHRAATFSRGKYYLGSVLTWDTTARLKSSLSVIANLSDSTSLNHLSFSYSWEQNLDLLIGSYFNLNSADPDITYASLRYTF